MRSQSPSRKLSKHPRIDRHLAWINENWPVVGQAIAMPKRLAESVDDFGNRAANRDLRGARVAAIDLTERTLRHVKSAVRRTDGANGTTARQARRFLKSLQHVSDFGETVEKAREFAGEVQKAGKRKASKRAVCEPEEHVVGNLRRVGRLCLRRVVSVAELRKIGRQLNLCVAHASEVGRPYHTELKNLETEFWTLGSASAPIALLSVEDDDGVRRVTDFQGQNGYPPVAMNQDERKCHLPGWLLRNVMRRLDADASDQPCFSCKGAFRSLLPRAARRKYRDVVVEGRHYRVWRFPEELIVASSKNRPKGAMPGRGARWSRFVRRPQRPRRRATKRSVTRYDWHDEAWHEEAMDFGVFLGLLERSPEMYDAFAGRV